MTNTKHPTRVLFVACSDDHWGAQRALERGALILQVPAGAFGLESAAARATVAYALAEVGVEEVVLLAHDGCGLGAFDHQHGPPAVILSAMERAFCEDPELATLLARYPVEVRVGWGPEPGAAHSLAFSS